ncbi:hypothetical protein FDUTEX481_05003 [Tolypothrix sp. PCC 7601]|nr:hypothetical protein FDUTEX481_05003 [Tolypothrix sp. PCC 7601]
MIYLGFWCLVFVPIIHYPLPKIAITGFLGLHLGIINISNHRYLCHRLICLCH